MSRGFVKEDDQEELPIVPPRADLPAGSENWVTQKGMEDLQNERSALMREQENLDRSQEREYRIAFNYIDAKLRLLNSRIASAKIFDTAKIPQNEVHFGAVVTFKNVNNKVTQTFQLVGVDEANVTKGKVAFTTPLAKALLHKKIGEQAVMNVGALNNVFEILDIKY